MNTDVTNGNRIEVKGNVNLILCDGKKLAASNRGITVTQGNTLNIYAQSGGTGELEAKNTDDYDNDFAAGIGGCEGQAGGTVVIHGGTVNASSGGRVYHGAGIGGGRRNVGGTVIIYGGTVTATGSWNAAGIGGGGGENNAGGGAGGTLTIYGGTVTANGGYCAAGIGGGAGGVGGMVTIYGGVVTANGNSDGEGIGKGYGGGNSGTLTLGKGIALFEGTNNTGTVLDNNATSSREYTGARKANMYAEKFHPHSFTYEKTGEDTITAKCSNTEDCPLADNNYTATLTIGMPTESSGGKAVLTANPASAFGDLSNQIQYQKKNNDGTWSGATTSVPTEDGFYKASITLGTATATVTYGTNCIKYDNDPNAKGSIGGSTGAVVGATVEPGIKVEDDYELDTLTVTPAQGSGVSSVTMTEDGKGFIMPLADVTVSATFKRIEYAITTSVSPEKGGTLTVTRNGTAIEKPNKDDTITITATASEGYDPNGAITVTKTGDPDTTVTVTNNTFTMPAYAVTVTAVFTPIDYTVTVSPATNGTVTASKTSSVHVGDEVTLTVSPAADYTLNALTVTKKGGGNVTVTNNKFTMPADDVTVSATFKKIAYAVTPDGATATVTDNTPAQNKYTATLEVSDKDYDGEPVQARVTASQGFPTDKVAVGSVTYKDASGNAVTSPTDVGKYTASATVGGKTISKEFEIRGLEPITYSFTILSGGYALSVSYKVVQYVPLKSNPNGITFLKDGLTYAVKGNVEIGAIIYRGNVMMLPCKGSKLTVYAGIYHIGSTLDIYTEDGGDNAVINVTGEKSLSALDGDKTGISGEGASISGNIRLYSGNVNISQGKNAKLVADDLSLTLGMGVTATATTDAGAAVMTGGTENEDGSKTYTSSDFAKVTALSMQPVAVVKTAPTAKTGLTHNGTAQALLDNGGEAIGGTMQYALGTDEKTVPTSGWSATIPTGATVGTYYVWYGAKGDANHRDSDPAGPLTVAIAVNPNDTTGKTTLVIDGSTNPDAKDINDCLGANKDNSEALGTMTDVEIKNAANLETLSGIEKLGNVETLTITDAKKLTDISDVKKLDSLETLNISGADSLKDISAVKELNSLKTLDVSNCSSLETADLSGNKTLETLSVENCPALVSLDVSNGSLEKLEVSQCNNLKQLDCSNNQLGQLDAGNSRLPGLSDLWCSNQQISGWTAGLSMDLGQYAGTPSVNVAGAATLASTGKVLAVKATDSQGDIAVNYTPGGSTATFARTPEKVTYWYDTGFNNVSMDVTVSASGAGSHDGPTSNKGGGGCNAGLGLAGLLAVIPMFMRKRS